MSQADGGGAATGAAQAKPSAEPADEHERSMVYARKALAHIQALRLPATPRNYEIWYAYATGHYPSLNLMLDDLMRRRVVLEAEMIEQIGARFVSAGGIKERIDALGSRVAGEIDGIISAIERAIGSAGAQAEELDEIDQSIRTARDRDTLRVLVEKMVMAAIESKGDKRRLEQQLNSSKSEIAQLQEQLHSVRSASLRDPVTGLANRNAFQDALAQAVAKGSDRPLALMVGDIDRFKAFNDTWGHMTGDQVLRLVAGEMKRQVKDRGMVARYGGEEFALILPGMALQDAYDIAEQIRHAVMSRDVRNRQTGQNMGRVTISFGIAGLRAGDTVEALRARADACLDLAKCKGRNRVVCEIDPEFSDSGRQTAVA